MARKTGQQRSKSSRAKTTSHPRGSLRSRPLAPRRPPLAKRIREHRWGWTLRFAPLLLVLVPVVFNLVVLREEAVSAPDLNDMTHHESMVRWSTERIDAGENPFDGWYSDMTLGQPQFSYSHYLSYRMAGLFGSFVSVEAATKWALFLLLALAPLSFYAGAKLFGLHRWAAAGSALVSPLMVSASAYGWEHGSFIWRGYGMWTMLWGITLLPLTLGLSWRAVVDRRGIVVAGAAVGLVVGMHFLAGYLALMALPLWVLVGSPRDWLRRGGRALTVAGVAAGASVWAWFPLLTQGGRLGGVDEGLEGQFWADSYGARRVMRWFRDGDLFDNGRFPTITLLVTLGVVACVARWRSDERARGVLVFWLAALLMFFGRPTIGAVIDLLPYADSLWLHRFIVGVHVGGALVAGVGIWWAGSWIVSRARGRIPEVEPGWVAAGLGACVLIALVPAWRERAAFDRRGAELIVAQRAQEATDGADARALMDRASAPRDGRIYSGFRWNWGGQYKVGEVPMYVELLNHDAEGYVDRSSPATQAEYATRFDETKASHYDLFNVRYALLPAGNTLPVPGRVVERRGRHVLWEVPTSGYLEVIDTVAPLNPGSTFLTSELLVDGRFPVLDSSVEPSLAASGAPLDGPAGTVRSQYARPGDGVFGGEVEASREAAVLLKVSWAPRWRVEVDGARVDPYQVEPGLVAVPVPQGSHHVSFEYVPYASYPALFGLAALTILGAGLGPGLAGRFLREGRTAPADDEEGARASTPA